MARLHGEGGYTSGELSRIPAQGRLKIGADVLTQPLAQIGGQRLDIARKGGNRLQIQIGHAPSLRLHRQLPVNKRVLKAGLLVLAIGHIQRVQQQIRAADLGLSWPHLQTHTINTSRARHGTDPFVVAQQR